MRTALFCVLLVTIAQQCVVGYPGKSKRGLASRIVNGKTAVPNSIPYQVYVETFTNNIRFGCGGTIVSEYHILTAAHCITDDKKKRPERPENVKIRVGEHHLNRDDDIETVMDVMCIAVHPSFDIVDVITTQSGGAWDYAILTLKEKIKFNEYVKPAKLPSPDDTDFENAELTISGWGETHDEERPNELRMAKVRVASKKDVRFLGMGQEIGMKDRKTLLFVGRVEEDPEDVKGACRGDSGGPLTWDDGGVKKVIGVSFFVSDHYCEDLLSAYGKVTSALDWIKEQGVEQGIQKCPSKKNTDIITETWYPTYDYETKQYTYYYDN